MISKAYKNNCQNLFELLIQNHIRFWLMAGTLLGAVRERNFIQHDNDVDIAIWAEDRDRFIEIIQNSDWYFFQIWRREIGVIRHGYIRNESKIDVFCMDKDNDSAYMYLYMKNPLSSVWDTEWRFKFPKELFEELIPYNIDSVKCFIPKEAESILDLEYTQNWRTPDKTWINNNAPCFDKDYKELAIIIPTFLRNEKLKDLIQSISKTIHSEKYRLYIADQGLFDLEQDEYYKDLQKDGHKTFYLPFNSGLSYARNYLVKQTKEPFILLIDDDFYFTEDTKIQNFIYILNNRSDLGIIGGKLKDHEDYHFRLIKMNNKFYYIKLNPKEWYYTLNTYLIKPIRFWYSDIVLNFAMFKREVFDNHKWDNELKLAEHSVTKNTSIFLKNGYNKISCIPIYKLFPSSQLKWKNNQYFFSKSSKLKIWTDNGWQHIIGVFKHKVEKEIYSITTNHGYIECTSDHSLIINNKEIKPTELKVGDSIELCNYPSLSNKLAVDKEWAWLLGLFLAEGCYATKSPDCNIANQDLKILNKAKNILQKFAIDSHIVLNQHKKNRCNYLQFKPYKMIDGYFSYFYIDREKIIPYFVFDFDLESRKSFFEGFMIGDGDKTSECKGLFSQKSQSIVNGLIYLLSDVYINRHISAERNKFGDWFRVNFKQYQTKNKMIIKKITKKFIDDYVYDVETENHHFCGGIGNINLHNTYFYWTLKQLKKWKVAFTDTVIAEHHKSNNNQVYNDFRGTINNKLGVELFHKKMDLNENDFITISED